MGEGFDQIDKKGFQKPDRKRKLNPDEEEVNIVYARDPKVFDTKTGFANQRNAFQHENMLDIKSLVAAQESRAPGGMRMGGIKPTKVVRSQEEKDHDRMLEAKARYR
jgi:hypothetical protein